MSAHVLDRNAPRARETDPMVRATAVATTPDLAALAALDEYIEERQGTTTAISER
jgi:hypothetical protein